MILSRHRRQRCDAFELAKIGLEPWAVSFLAAGFVAAEVGRRMKGSIAFAANVRRWMEGGLTWFGSRHLWSENSEVLSQGLQGLKR